MWTAYRVEYSNGEYRYFNNDHNALLHAGRMAKTIPSVSVTVNGVLIARWEHSRIVYYAPDIPHSLI
jgi:hypothetical protein